MREIEVFSPARVDFAGGTLDIYPVYLFFQNCFTLNATLSCGVRIFLKEKKGKILLTNLNSGYSEHYPSTHKDLLIVSNLLDYLGIDSGVEISFSSDFPQGSSLGVSSSILVGIFYGLKEFFNLKFSRKNIAEILKNIETVLIGYPAGLQDYLAPLYGGMNAFYFGVDGYSRKKLKIDSELSNRLLFVYTGQSHFSGAPNWQLFKGFFDGNPNIKEGFNRIYENSHETLNAIENNDFVKLGKLLKKDFLIRKTMLSSLVPNITLFDFLDNVEQVLGYRLCGAASGGTVVVLVEAGKKKYVKEIVKEAGYRVFDCSIKNTKVKVKDV